MTLTKQHALYIFYSYFFLAGGGSLKHSIRLLLFRPFCSILLPIVGHKKIPAAGLECVSGGLVIPLRSLLFALLSNLKDAFFLFFF